MYLYLPVHVHVHVCIKSFMLGCILNYVERLIKDQLN